MHKRYTPSAKWTAYREAFLEKERKVKANAAKRIQEETRLNNLKTKEESNKKDL